MLTLNSISGGRSSAYMAVHYPSDLNLFALVLLDEPKFKWQKGKDEPTRQKISDRIGREFVGTAEFDVIIYTILDLEQMLGKEIKFLSGLSWEQLIIKKKGYLPNHSKRFCTTQFKVEPIFNYLYQNELLPIYSQLGFRFGEEKRKFKSLERHNDDGFEYHFKQLGLKPGSRYHNRKLVKYRKCTFPLIENQVSVLDVNSYWSKKNVRFADYNNCINCVNRSALFLAHLSRKHPREFAKGIYIEDFAKKIALQNSFKYEPRLRPEATMREISNYNPQMMLFDSDFTSCDSGYCGL